MSADVTDGQLVDFDGLGQACACLWACMTRLIMFSKTKCSVPPFQADEEYVQVPRGTNEGALGARNESDELTTLDADDDLREGE